MTPITQDGDLCIIERNNGSEKMAKLYNKYIGRIVYNDYL